MLEYVAGVGSYLSQSDSAVSVTRHPRHKLERKDRNSAIINTYMIDNTFNGEHEIRGSPITGGPDPDAGWL